ncbi:MAG: YggS family pyridoxal phosphate-dependent enzyme [Candidatus Nanopelagicales bacterium]
MTRDDELRDNLSAVRERIERACRAAGRDPADVTLIVVTKTWPADDVRRLVGLGVTDVGENRDQEAGAKVRDCADLAVRWHFIGQVQRNKAASIARYADVVQSVDRVPLVTALDRGAARAGRELDVLVQVSLDPEPGRGGCPPDQVGQVSDAVTAAEHLTLRGLMAVAPLHEDPATAFARLAPVREQVLDRHPEADWLSAGMSGDLEQAISAGATHVRVGSAVLGVRENVG